MRIDEILAPVLAEDQTDTPEFRRWFGASKVVDGTGRPLRLYHGTSHAHIRQFEVGFNSFGTKEFAGNKVISFTTDPDFAAGYAGNLVATMPERRPTIYPVYIRSLNPGDFRNPEHVAAVRQSRRDGFERWLENTLLTHSHIWTPAVIEKERAKLASEWDRMIPHGAWMYWEDPKLWAQMGWDGAWSREDVHHPNAHVLNFAVADGRQVKSATGNRGSFDPADLRLSETRPGQ